MCFFSILLKYESCKSCWMDKLLQRSKIWLSLLKNRSHGVIYDGQLFSDRYKLQWKICYLYRNFQVIWIHLVIPDSQHVIVPSTISLEMLLTERRLHVVSKEGHHLATGTKSYSLQIDTKASQTKQSFFVIDVDGQWDLDLMNTTRFSKYNRGYSFILVAIDIFCDYVLLQSLRWICNKSIEKHNCWRNIAFVE